MQRDREKPFFMPQRGFKKPGKKKKGPGVTLDSEHIRRLRHKPIPEPPAEAPPLHRMHAPFIGEPLGPHLLGSATRKILMKGRVETGEHDHVGRMVRALADTMCKVEALEGFREGALGSIASIASHYPNPMAILSKFMDAYGALCTVESIVREGRKFPVRVGMEEEANRFAKASRPFLSLEGLDGILACVEEACLKDGISAYKIEFISPEMLRRISGEHMEGSSWMKVPSDMPKMARGRD
jgi:hypothetical protein